MDNSAGTFEITMAQFLVKSDSYANVCLIQEFRCNKTQVKGIYRSSFKLLIALLIMYEHM